MSDACDGGCQDGDDRETATIPFEQKLSDDDVITMRRLRADARLGWSRLGRMFGIHRRHAYRICTGRARRDIGGPLEPEDTPEPIEPEVRCPDCGGTIEKLPCLLCSTRSKAPAIRLLVDSGLVSERELYGKVREKRERDPSEDAIYQRAAALRAKREAVA